MRGWRRCRWNLLSYARIRQSVSVPDWGHYDGDFGFGFRPVVTLSWPALTALCAIIGIPLFGLGVALDMSGCQHYGGNHPSLKED